MSDDTREEGRAYVVEAENAAEMARLINQDRDLSRGMGGLFPKQLDLTKIHDVLDLACGPGGWAIDVASTYPSMNVTAVDISPMMIRYATSIAQTRNRDNVAFRVMNIQETPLDFPTASFDFINIRFIASFMTPTTWPVLLRECMRLLRPAGFIRLTESEEAITNSPSGERISSLITQAFKITGRSFSPDGRHVCITPMLKRLLREAGYQHISHQAYAINASIGTEAYPSCYQNMVTVYQLLQPFLVQAGVTTQEELALLYQRTLVEMKAEDFCSMWFWLSVLGQKPVEEN